MNGLKPKHQTPWTIEQSDLLYISIAQVSRGPGLWKFNNSLLDDEKYVDLIRENYTAIREKYTGLEDRRLKWELIKMELRSLTIPYSKHKAKKCREKETNTQKRMEELDNLISNAANTDHIAGQSKTESIKLKEDLCHICCEVTRLRNRLISVEYVTSLGFLLQYQLYFRDSDVCKFVFMSPLLPRFQVIEIEAISCFVQKATVSRAKMLRYQYTPKSIILSNFGF